MILLIDIGNTKIKLGTYNLKKKIIVNVFSINTYSKLLEKEIKSIVKKKKIKSALISSVVPTIIQKTNKILKKLNIQSYEIKNSKIKKNIKLNIRKKNQVGSDRIVNSIAAIKLFKKNSIIVDFGTATTFDIILSNKSYEGGVIAPGVKLSINSMYQATANLPLIKLRNQKKITGKDTVSAMNSGIFFGYIYMINGIIAQIIKENKKQFKVILTGGYSDVFKKYIKPKAVINKNITLIGLAETVNHNTRLFSEV